MKNTSDAEEGLYHLTLLRHGESIGNAQGLLQGQTDFELSTFGRQQTQRLAARWVSEDMQFEQIISSSLSRARQTAEIIGAALSLPVALDSDWMERDFGSLNGQVLSEEDLREFQDHEIIPSRVTDENGESQWDTYCRAERALAKILRHPPGCYLVVAHGGIINQAIHSIFDLSPERGSNKVQFILSNAAFATLSYSSFHQQWRLFRWNDDQHLIGLTTDLPKNPEVDQADIETAQLSDYALKRFRVIPIQIRPAQPSDLEEILKVFFEADQLHAVERPDVFSQPPGLYWAQSFYESQFAEANTHMLVALTRGEIIGALYGCVKDAPQLGIRRARRWLSIDNIAVKSAYRGLGVGTALMKNAHDLGRELGVQAIELTVWEFNSKARRFYEHLGYQTSRRVMWLDVK